MLMIDEAGVKAVCELTTELAWLEEHHPEKKRLIGLARDHLRTISQAGSCDTNSLHLLQQLYSARGSL